MTRPGMGLTCAEFVELVTDYLEGTLPAEDRLRFEDHLAICDGCTTYLDQMERTIRTVGYLREDDVQGEARARLLEAFHTWRDGYA
jgi:anti-sigma factor RsiW